jgi:hypothetical protein
MPASRAQQAQVAERRARAIQLRIAGVPFATIATQLGYKTASAASQDVGRALASRRDELRDQADLLQALEAEKLDALERGMWTVFRRRHVLVSQGQIMRGPDGEPFPDDDPATRAAGVLLRAFERRAKLHGLDAPTKITGKFEVQDELDADVERLVAELARTPARGEGEAAGPAPGGADSPAGAAAAAVAQQGQAEAAPA